MSRASQDDQVEDDEEDKDEENARALETAHQQELFVHRRSEEVAAPVKSSYPSFADVYGMIPSGQCVIAPSVEKCLKPIWKLWDDFCCSNNRDPYVSRDGTGLYLYSCSESSFTSSTKADENSYLTCVVRDFFSYLLDENLSSDVMTKAKTFINAHLKAE